MTLDIDCVFASCLRCKISLTVYLSHDLLIRSNLAMQPESDDVQLLTHTSFPSNSMLETPTSMKGVLLVSGRCACQVSVELSNSTTPAAVASHNVFSLIPIDLMLSLNESPASEKEALLIEYLAPCLSNLAKPFGVPIQSTSSFSANARMLLFGNPS